MLELLRIVSLRRLLGAPARSLLIVFGIALGVASLVATLAMNRSILGSFHEMVERVAGQADLIVTHGEAGVDEGLIEELRALPGVAHVAGSLEITSRRPEGGGPVLVLGVDFLGDRHFLPLRTLEGEDLLDDPFALVNDPSAILISEALSRATGARVDDSISLLTPDGARAFVVRAILGDEGLAATFGGQVVVMFSAAAQLAFGREGRVDRVDVALQPGADREATRARIESQIAGRARVEAPDGRTRHLEGITGPIRRGTQIGGAVALCVAMFLIYNAVGIAVAERRREIGTLRALGVRRAQIRALFSLEALALGGLGVAMGLPLSIGLARLALARAAPTVSRFYAPVRPAPPELTWDLALLGAALGLIATWAAAQLPAHIAASVEPAWAIRRVGRGPLDSKVPRGRLALLGLALLPPAALAAEAGTLSAGLFGLLLVLAGGVACIPVGLVFLKRALLGAAGALSTPARLGLENAERSLGRSALTASALFTAVASSVSLSSWGVSLEASMLDWLDQSLPADLYVTSGSFIADQHNVPFRADVVDTLRGVPGVAAAFPVRMAALDVGDKRVQLITVDARILDAQLERKKMPGRKAVDGPERIDTEAFADTPSVVLAENAAKKLGVRAGEDLVLQTALGPRPFRVLNVVVDYTSDQGTCLMDGRWYRELFQDPLVDTVDVFLEEGADPAEVAEAVRARLGGASTLFVVSAVDVRAEIRKVIAQSMSIFEATDLLALMVALLGVVGTMLAAVLDRTREIGLLRAIGATQRQVVGSIVAESSFLGLVAALGGVLWGAPMGYLFVKVLGRLGTGWHLDYQFPIESAARVAGLVVLTAALAGLYPGRRAAALPVPEALACE